MVKVPLSLRERQKLQTRDALAAEAFRLCKQRGFDGVTIDEIAAAAEVSRRTFFRYFPTKESAFFPHTPDRVRQFRAQLAGRSAKESTFDVARRIFRELAAVETQNRIAGVARRRLIRSSPALLAHESAVADLYAGALADALAADRTVGGGPRRARMLAAAMMAMVQTALRDWGAENGKTDLERLCAEAVDVVQRGAESLARGQTRAASGPKDVRLRRGGAAGARAGGGPRISKRTSTSGRRRRKTAAVKRTR